MYSYKKRKLSGISSNQETSQKRRFWLVTVRACLKSIKMPSQSISFRWDCVDLT